MSERPSPDEVRSSVRTGYARIAETGVWLGQSTEEARQGGEENLAQDGAEAGSSCCAGGGCCGPTTIDASALGERIGYAVADLEGLPEGANMGLSCGNPTAIAALRPGETVVDLGAGGGLDVFLGGRRVGPSGRAIGVDMTPEMVSKARRGVEAYARATGFENVEFRLGEIEHLPVADETADCVISNCVLNLSPEKPRVWREIARILKAGGRVAISDLALRRPLPEGVRAMVDALIGCVAGASLIEDLERDALGAGLTDVSIEIKPGYVEALLDAADPLYEKMKRALPEGESIGDYVVSVGVTARKAASGRA